MDRAGVEHPALSMFPKVQVLLLHGVLRQFQPKIGWNWRCPFSNPRQINFRVNHAYRPYLLRCIYWNLFRFRPSQFA